MTTTFVKCRHELQLQYSRCSVDQSIKNNVRNRPSVSKTGCRFNINMSYQYRDPHVRDKTISLRSYLWRGISHTKSFFYIKTGHRWLCQSLIHNLKKKQYPPLIFFDGTFNYWQYGHHFTADISAAFFSAFMNMQPMFLSKPKLFYEYNQQRRR